MSGHSKWANIKHKKAAKDAKRGKVFTRLAKELTIASREGGGDPDMNPRLRLAVQNAKAANMPAENIKRAILKGTGDLEGASYEEITYEGFAPLGVSIIIETVTDNRNRTFPEIRSTMSKLGGNLGEPGSVAWNFERKGVVTIKSNGKTEDQLLEEVLEAGADDLEYDEEESRVICGYESLAPTNKYFEDKKFEITECRFEYLPKTSVKIESLTDAKRILKFIDNMEDMDDVQNIFTNHEFTDAVAEQLENED
jgi:YebC/PmpR family DNA-binding regulatory protein